MPQVNPKLRHLSVAELSELAQAVDRLCESTGHREGPDSPYLEYLRQRRKLFLDELVARGELERYGFVPAA